MLHVVNWQSLLSRKKQPGLKYGRAQGEIGIMFELIVIVVVMIMVISFITGILFKVLLAMLGLALIYKLIKMF